MDIAKPSYTARLQDIWEEVMADDAVNAAIAADAEAGVLRHVMPARPNATLKLMRKDGRKVRPFWNPYPTVLKASCGFSGKDCCTLIARLFLSQQHCDWLAL